GRLLRWRRRTVAYWLPFFNATGGANWKKNSNWNTGAPLSDWHGVGVNDEGHVVKLDLDSNKLEGLIPKELGALSKLKHMLLEE
ncbi:unnamed protein product, partial [Ectocarpus sp. 4 AP-2014]